MIKAIKMLVALIGAEAGKLPFIFLCFFAASFVDLIGLTLMIPVISVFLFDDLTSDAVSNSFMQYVLGYVQGMNLYDLAFLLFVVFFLKAAITIIVQAIIVSFVQQQRAALGANMLDRYLSTISTAQSKDREADQIYNLQTLTIHFTTAIHAALKLLNDSLIGAAVLFLLILVDPITFVILASIIALIISIYMVKYRRKIVGFGRILNENMADALQTSQESIRGMREIYFLGKKNFFIRNYKQALMKVKKAAIGIEIHAILPRIIAEMIIVLFIVIALLFMASNLINPADIAPVFSIYALAAVRLIPIFSSLAAHVTRFRSVENSIERLYNDAFKAGTMKHNITSAGQDSPRPTPFQSLQFDRVSFAYDEATPIINDLSLTINRGDIIGVFGPSGTGKSTFIRLILGLIEPTEGRVLLNGTTPHDEIKQGNLGFAYIPQDAVMLNRSVLENITLGHNSDAQSHQNVQRYLEQAKLGHITGTLADGLNETIGDFGARFSAGQKQRLAFARVIAHGKSFYVLDESTNALDMKTEHALLKDLIEGGIIETALIVSHRPSTLTHCHYILEFTTGGIKINKNPKSFIAKLEGRRRV